MKKARSYLVQLARREWRELVTIHPSDRPWEMPFAAALSAGIPLLAGAATGQLQGATIASMAGMAFLYLPATPVHHRMATIMACSFGMICCYGVGAVSHLAPVAQVPLMTITATLTTMVCRYYRIGPPGSLFFIMITAIAAFSPGTLGDLPARIGMVVLGRINAAAVAFVYSLYMLRRGPSGPIPPPPVNDFERVWLDSIVIGLSVGLSLAAAQVLQLDNAYWVPVSCLAVIQGISLRAAWNRQVHRSIGSAVGLALTWGLVGVLSDDWSIAVVLIVLTFLIETAVVRHYGFAAVFITPLTIILAEAPTMGDGTSRLMQARLVDTLLGAAIGFAGAICLHNPRFRAWFGSWLRRLIPARMIFPPIPARSER